MARGEGSGVGPSPDPKNAKRGEAAGELEVLRDFGGANVQSPREDIADNEFAWIEEAIPIGPGNLVPVLGPSAALVTITGEAGAPTLTIQFSLSGVDTILAIWANSGNAWAGTATAGVTWTHIGSGFTSGKTAAASWSNIGVLIVDPVLGYYDYNVTTALTLTHNSGQLYGPAMTTNNPAQLATGLVPPLRVLDPTGGFGAVGASASAISAVLAAAGTGYLVGDVLIANGGTLTTSTAAPASQQNQPLVINVLAVGGAGAITAFSLSSPGYYQAAPGNPVPTLGGTGTGATFNVTWLTGNPFLISPGSLYTAPVVQGFIGGVWVNFAMTVFTSGTVLGSAIAVFAGRVWIAINRTVQFTDADSYASFGNSGSAFTINDSYLHGVITALYAANNYLYIFGDDSIDILSNVTVVNGLAQFSRVNVSSSVGTTQPYSIFPFLRGLAFSNPSGFYVISGATPEKVSDRLDNLITATDFTKSVYGCQVMVSNILCAAFLITFHDSFTRTPTQTRSMLVLMFRGKWWFTSQTPVSGVNLGAVVSYPVKGLSAMFGWAGNSLYALQSAANINPWLLRTKLWDSAAALFDKQGIFVGVGAVLAGATFPGFSVTLDTESVSVPTTVANSTPIVQWVNNAGQITTWVNNAFVLTAWERTLTGYNLFTAPANSGGGKYLGLTVTGSNNVTQIRLLALEMEKRRRW